MRPDDINPRTGLVVALVSVFLVFGFMFTVSGIKGESLGDIPLLAIGPAICLPGIAAIALTKKTDGCTKWPEARCCPPCCCCCCRKKPKDKDALELLRTPSDLESGKGSCDELAKEAYAAEAGKASPKGGGGEGEGSLATCAVAAGQGSLRKVEQEEMLRYLENCYPEMPGNVFVAEATPYSALEKEQQQQQQELSPGLEGATACPDTEDNIFVAPRDSIIVCSYKDNSPYDRYCCYINPSEEISSDQETVV
ncbi:transmembrane protein 215 [Rhineura floridana]|uniref:transmembrane protein 215 n=1 Tax=Rhineura floridana TaxID=261503 RepID=UPI002AC82AE9|nr:transmembrane protein 215 [Rhineura floridana]